MNIKMNIKIMSLIFSHLSSLLLAFVVTYLYKVNRLKYFKRFATAIFIFSTIYLVDIFRLEYVNNIATYLTIKIIQFLGLIFIILGLYDYVKREKPKYFLYITNFIALTMLIICSKMVSFIEKDLLIYFIFGLTMIFSSIFLFYYFRKAQVGKHITGIATLILGVIYIKNSLNYGYYNNVFMSHFLEPAIFLLVSIGFMISYYEITKNELEVSEKRYKLAMEGANDGLWELDLIKNTTFLSPKTLDMIGLDNEKLIIDLDLWKSFIHPDDVENLNKNLQEHILGNSEKYRAEYRVKCKNGDYRWILAKGIVMNNHKGKPIKVVGSHTDTTERKNAEEKIYNLAYFDRITGLPNRTYFEDKLCNRIQTNENTFILSIGLNGLKNVNDSLGYVYGDTVLKEISLRIESCLCNDCILSRFGGDQFIVLMKNIKDRKLVETLSISILHEINKSLKINNSEFYITGNIGISLYPEDGHNLQEIIKYADLAMYKSKEKGNNSYEFYNKYMNEEIHKRLYLEESLHNAVENNEFVVYYQLQKDIINNKFSGAEALVRWIHPEKGFISPADFIPLAEETGLIIPIGEFVLRESCKKAKALHDKGYNDFVISVNVSEIQLENSNFVQLVKTVLNETGLQPKFLTIEITESIFMKSLDGNIKILEELRDMGVNIALDDFGTGYSSFSYLMNLPIDILKIDKSFVDGITESTKKESIFGSIVSIAKKIELFVVAEGVETFEQLDILKKQDCDKIQGYLFSKPMPENEIVRQIA